jgi:toxin ParE1/3/4
VTAGYSLRQQAQDDLESIWIFSSQEWGADQADHYIRSLLSRFAWLSVNPQLGKHRAEIKSGYYCFPEGMHLIFYKITPDGIDIIGIPHQNMDIVGYFQT